MPELPEVEVIRRGLAPVLVGRRFLAVQVGAKRLRQQSSPKSSAAGSWGGASRACAAGASTWCSTWKAASPCSSIWA